ncbi:MAG: hypothetical protein JOZ22_10545, partial [Acidobacteriia bacterium]|nr:hypothetical protein [Terriglobia bacterium]
MPAAITKSATLPIVLLVFGTFAMSVPALAQTDTSTPAAKSFDEAVDRAISNEQHLMATLRNRQPIVETYIQELKPDPEVGSVPDRDFYFLGKLDLSHGMTVDSFIPAGAMIKKRFHLFTATFNIWNTFFPSGFASRILIDEGFNRSTYSFEYVKREFLGEVRCIVIDVRPQPHIGKGRFQGRIWVEDRDYNIVRFNGSYTGGYGYLHFDSWRVNAGPNLWVPAAVYTEEDSYS